MIFPFISIPLEHMEALVGTNNVRQGGYFYHVRNVIIHPDFHLRTMLNDIALVEIHNQFTFSSDVKSIALPNENIIHDNDSVVLSGFGTKEVSLYNCYCRTILFFYIIRNKWIKNWLYFSV